MPGKGTIDAVIILRWIQEEYIAKQQKLYMCFVDLGKVFDSFKKHCGMGNDKEKYSRSIGDSSDKPVQRCKDKSKSWNTFSDELEANVGVHHESALSTLLFAIVVKLLRTR